MSHFILEIELGNDSMQSSEDLVNALEMVASRLRKSQYLELSDSKVLTRGIADNNGNTVGSWKIEE